MEKKNLEVIALVDTMWVGHHPTYFKFIIKTLLQMNYEVWTFCPEPCDVHNWTKDNIDSSLRKNLYVRPMAEIWEERSSYHRRFLSQGFNAASLWNVTYKAIKRLSDTRNKLPKLVFFPKVDSWLSGLIQPSLLNKIFPLKWSGIYFHPFHIRVDEKLKNPIKNFISNHLFKFGVLSPITTFKDKNCVAISALDENILDILSNQVGKLAFHFPDITDESPPDLEWEVYRDVMQKAKGRKIIGLLGGLDRRKGIFSLLEIAKKSDSNAYFFLFAGKVEYSDAKQDIETLSQMLSDARDNIYCYFERIPDGSKFNALVNACDIIFASYENYPYSSNLMTKASLFQKPIIVSKGGLMEERIKLYNLGTSVTFNNADEGVKAIEFLLRDFPISCEPRFYEYFKQHSHQRLSSFFSELLSLA